MADLLLTAVEYGGYVSVIKLAVFLILFFLWLPLPGWVCRDAKTVGTRDVFWTALVFAAGAAAALIWLFIPIFVIGMLFYLITVAAASFSYVMHRNSKVADFDRVMTAEHIKSLFVSKSKAIEDLKNLIFITANNNEVPVPEPKTPDFFGFRKAYEVLNDAIKRRASDIIFSPTQNEYEVTYYVDGAGLKQPPISRNQMEQCARFLKHLADLDADEKRKPQKGKFRTNRDKHNIDWQLTTAGSTVGEQIRLKQLVQMSMSRLTDIGLTPEQYQQMNMICQARQGLFIIAGPKKSGVTTTFYAMLRNHDAFMNSISTLERQPSFMLPNITQNIFTLSDTGTTTYAKKLHAMVTTEPDVIGVADCEDSETAKIAAAAAADNKIVYVTLDADNVIQALRKWIKLLGDKSLSADILLGISNQRLLRKLCDECKQAYEPNKELLRKFNIPPEKAKVLYRAGKVNVGKHGKTTPCENCQETGFVGRMPVFEIIRINDELRKTIKQSKSLSEINTQFRRAKMLYLQEQALKKVLEGQTSINEMVRIFSAVKKNKNGTDA